MLFNLQKHLAGQYILERVLAGQKTRLRAHNPRKVHILAPNVGVAGAHVVQLHQGGYSISASAGKQQGWRQGEGEARYLHILVLKYTTKITWWMYNFTQHTACYHTTGTRIPFHLYFNASVFIRRTNGRLKPLQTVIIAVASGVFTSLSCQIQHHDRRLATYFCTPWRRIHIHVYWN